MNNDAYKLKYMKYKAKYLGLKGGAAALKMNHCILYTGIFSNGKKYHTELRFRNIIKQMSENIDEKYDRQAGEVWSIGNFVIIKIFRCHFTLYGESVKLH